MKLLTNRNAVCVGVQYEYHGSVLQEHGPVILCTGGFGADFAAGGMLEKYRPDLLHLPTTCGEQSVGDGIRMGQMIGGAAIGLEWVEVHPTGFVKADDPDAKLKIVATELLSGVGGILLDSRGKRFVNELDVKERITQEMWKSTKAPFRVVLNSKAAEEIEWHLSHYKSLEVMELCETGADLATMMDIKPEVLEETFNEYNTAAAKSADGEPDAPYKTNGCKTWDKFGKKRFPNAPFSFDDSFHVAVVTPVVHHTVGGLEIDESANVVDTRGRKIQGLYAAGEVAACPGGKNQLAGNGLLECLVFGRVAGKAVASFMLPEVIPTSLVELSGKLVDADTVVVVKGGDDDESEDDDDGGGGGITVEEVAGHDKPGDVWIIVNNKVIDVTEFVKTHPGGEAAIMAFAGKDASVEWNMIHKPDFLDIHVKDKILGEIGAGGGGGGGKKKKKKKGGDDDGGGSGISPEEVAAHDKPGDVWIIVNNKVIDVSEFVKTHPGGEAAIMAFAGKDASVEWNMIHKPDFLEVHVPDKILGELGKGGGGPPKKAVAAPPPDPKPAAEGDKSTPLLDKGEEKDAPPPSLRQVVKEAVMGFAMAMYYLVFAWIRELVYSIFTGGNFLFSIKSERCGLTRSAFFLVLFITIHAFGNVNLFSGPDSFNGYGHMFVRLYWTGFGLQANIVEEYLLLAGLLHIVVALMRTWEISMGYTLASGKLNLALTGILLIIYMTIHLQQFRFAATEPYSLRTPSFYVNLNIWEVLDGCVFHTMDESRPFVETRDIYRLEMDLFAGPGGWKISLYYVAMVLVFGTHMCLGWAKVIPAGQLGIPREYQNVATIFGYVLCASIMLTYISFPIYCNLVGPQVGMYNRGPNDY
jgi:cytochrome b involved in lipid metabolism